MLSMARRGDVFEADLNPPEGSEQAGTRPVVVVSRDAINATSPNMVIVPVTSLENKRRLYPSHVVLKAGSGGLSKDSVALAEHVRSISQTRLRRYLGHLRPDQMAHISVAIKVTLDLP